MLELDRPASYRSGETGNWYADRWPFYLLTNLPKMERGKSDCSADPREISAIRDFIADVGGDVVLTQIPSVFSCPQRIQEIADAVGVPFFAPDPAGYGTTAARPLGWDQCCSLKQGIVRSVGKDQTL